MREYAKSVGGSFSQNRNKYYFAKVSKEVFQMLGLTSGAIVVYSYLSGLVSPESPYPWPSYQKIAEASHMSRRTAIEKIKELLNAGLIEKRATYSNDYRQQRSNVYNILPVPDIEVARKNKVIAKLELDRYRNQLLKKSTKYVTKQKFNKNSGVVEIEEGELEKFLGTGIREQIRQMYLFFLKNEGGEKSAPYIDLQKNTELKKSITVKKEKYTNNLVTCRKEQKKRPQVRVFLMFLFLWILPEGRAGP